MIIAGYPCIGKTTLAHDDTRPLSNLCKGIIDLDSSLFTKHQNWYEEYVRVATALSEQGFLVFISTHSDVIDELLFRLYTGEIKDDVAIVYPHYNLKDEWIKRATSRYNNNNTDANARALKNIENHFHEQIASLNKKSHLVSDWERQPLFTCINEAEGDMPLKEIVEDIFYTFELLKEVANTENENETVSNAISM